MIPNQIGNDDLMQPARFTKITFSRRAYFVAQGDYFIQKWRFYQKNVKEVLKHLEVNQSFD